MKKLHLDKYGYGANFTTSSAINQLEMWQAESFDIERIDQEFQWAAQIGMSLMRIYMHDLLHADDAEGMFNRMDQLLSVAEKNGIKIIFVLFDDCWCDHFKLGKQPDPIPFTHNSGWVKSPGTVKVQDPTLWVPLELYVKETLTRFAHDSRIALWDIYNEPGGGNGGDLPDIMPKDFKATLRFLKEVFKWAREVEYDQPLTSGVWAFSEDFEDINRFLIDESDVISFHAYLPPDILRERINFMKHVANGRDIICTEYMARTVGSTFIDCLPIFKAYNIPAINWGLVAGKIQTHYPWGWSAEKGEPTLYHHDVFHNDGTPFYQEEANFFADFKE